MERIETPFHEHPLIPFNRFTSSWCRGCCTSEDENVYIYGGYRCNESGCDDNFVLHKECAKPLQEINHSSHLNHPLKLTNLDSKDSTCCFCRRKFSVGYHCSVCDFKLDLVCARSPKPLVLPESSYGHKHPLKFLIGEVPDYADNSCLLCDEVFDGRHHHCDICNFSICRACMINPPPVDVECPTTHEHQLHLVPRHIDFICDACGTQGDRSPYLCLQCNFMIHRECIDLPRVININRHDHRISYTCRLGHGEWKCRVCREKVDGFYGAYTCVKCPTFAVHARCATNKSVWDMVEREGTPEEEEIAPFVAIDGNTIKHFLHEHNLRINNKDDGMILHESVLCKACVFQICSEPFYSCEECDFILHQKCANLPRKKRHMHNNQPFTLHTDSHNEDAQCALCFRFFTGFRYISSGVVTIDVRCGSTSDSLEHESHLHPLYYCRDALNFGICSQCGNKAECFFRCVECDYILDGNCALLPKKVKRKRYDDHPLFLSFDDKNVEGEYWCEACETKVDKKKWFYTRNDCGITLHISCLVGDFSYIMPGLVINEDEEGYAKFVSNTSICRQICYVCNSRCKLPSIIELSSAGDVGYFCSRKCILKQ